MPEFPKDKKPEPQKGWSEQQRTYWILKQQQRQRDRRS